MPGINPLSPQFVKNTDRARREWLLAFRTMRTMRRATGRHLHIDHLGAIHTPGRVYDGLVHNVWPSEVKILARLPDRHPAWARAIIMAGEPGGGYVLASW